MTGFFDDSLIELTCPSCTHKFKERLGKLKANPKLPCPGCGSVISIDATQLTAALEEVDKSVAELRKTICSFNKKR